VKEQLVKTRLLGALIALSLLAAIGIYVGRAIVGSTALDGTTALANLLLVVALMAYWRLALGSADDR
jgi:hypothetical protein